MKNVCIKPFDKTIELMAQNVDILNKFRKKGFVTRRPFVEIVVEKCPELGDYDGINKLGLYWLGRIKEKEFNNMLYRVLEQLKSE